MNKEEIVLCMGSSCYTRGNEETLATAQEFIKEKRLESDVVFRGELCSCNCKDGPNLKIGPNIFSKIDSTSILTILSDHFTKQGLLK